MAIIVRCSSCQRQLKVPDDLRGKRVRCPGCGATFTASAPEDEPPDREPRAEEDAPRRRRPQPEEESYEEEQQPRRRRPRPPPEEEYEEEDEYPDEDYDDEPRPRRRRRYRPHRGVLILVLGILSIFFALVGVCCAPVIFGPLSLGLGIPTWVLGQGDRKKMRDRIMDPNGQGLTTAGWICGIVGTSLGGLLLLCGILLFAIYGSLMALGAAGKKF